MGQSDPHLSPAGLTIATDGQLNELLEDLETWRKKLPESLQFNGPDTGPTAGMFWLRGVFDDWLRVALFVRAVIHALHLCEHDLLACIHADLLHMPFTPYLLLDG